MMIKWQDIDFRQIDLSPRKGKSAKDHGNTPRYYHLVDYLVTK